MYSSSKMDGMKRDSGAGDRVMRQAFLTSKEDVSKIQRVVSVLVLNRKSNWIGTRPCKGNALKLFGFVALELCI